jgi:hypothetical protein
MDENVTVELDVCVEPGEDVAFVAYGMSGDHIDFEVVLREGPTGWPLVAFHGPRPLIEEMLEDHGYEDGVETYEVEA